MIFDSFRQIVSDKISFRRSNDRDDGSANNDAAPNEKWFFSSYDGHLCEPQGTLCNKEVGVAVAVARKSQKIVPSRTIECRPDRCQFVEIATNGSDKQRLSHEFNCTSITFK
jgi:hypothetical protein